MTKETRQSIMDILQGAKMREGHENQDTLPPMEYKGEELTQPQMVMASVLEVAKSQDISCEEVLEKYSIEELAYYSKKEKFEEVKRGVLQNKKLTFIPFTENEHHVLIALVPPTKAGEDVKVVYMNSMPQHLPEYRTHPMAPAGKAAARLLAGGDKFVDASVEQQYASCCGFAVASNVAAIAKAYEENKDLSTLERYVFQPKPKAGDFSNAPEKIAFYKTMGAYFFDFLKRPKGLYKGEAPTVSRVRAQASSSYRSTVSASRAPQPGAELIHAAIGDAGIREFYKTNIEPHTKENKDPVFVEQNLSNIFHSIAQNALDKTKVDAVAATIKTVDDAIKAKSMPEKVKDAFHNVVFKILAYAAKNGRPECLSRYLKTEQGKNAAMSNLDYVSGLDGNTPKVAWLVNKYIGDYVKGPEIVKGRELGL
jgi:hypothetical protein